MVNLFTDKNTVKISPSIVVFTIFFLLSLVFLYYIRSIIVLLFLGFIIMVALNPAVTLLNNRLRLPRVLASLVVYLIMIGAVGTLIGLIIPPLTGQLYQLFLTLHVPPAIASEINNFKFTLENFTNLIDRVGGSVNMIAAIVSSTFSGLFTFFTLIVISFYLMLERGDLHKKAYWFTKDEVMVKKIRRFLDSLEMQLGGWVRGQLLLMFVIGTLSYVGLTLLGVPYALPLAILAGLLEILPNIGPTLAAVPAILLGYLAGGWVIALAVILMYVVIQALENYVIVPKIMRDNVDVNPLVALVTILIGLTIDGVVGALLAIPTYIVIRTAYAMWYKQSV